MSFSRKTAGFAVFFAAVTVLLGFGVFGTPKVRAEGPHTHCECGGTLNGVGKHVCSGTTQEWTAWSDTSTLPTESGYYYLTTDVSHWQICPAAGKEIHVCMNGHTFTGAVNDFVIRMANAGIYTFCDCQGTGKIVGKATHSAAGGMFNMSAANTTIRMYHVTVDATALNITNYGGIVNIGTASSVFEAYDTVFTGGKAGTTGSVNCGQIYNNGTLYLAGCTLQGGEATNYAGSLFLDGASTTTIVNSTISGGKAATGGGNIYIRTNATLTLDHSTVTGGNGCKNGGNIYTQDSAKVIIQNGSVISNGSVSEGGANILVQNSAQVSVLSGSTVSGGTAKNAGIIVKGGTLTVDSSVIKDANCSSTAGNIGITGGTVNISNSTVSGGKSGYCGGNIGIYGTSTTTISGTVISGGTATGGGWGGNIGIDAAEATLTLKNGCTLKDGTSIVGGNIMINSAKTADLGDTSISGGTASNHGGNIYLGNCSMTFAGTMTAGTASGIPSTKNISIIGGTAKFTMTGGTITGGGVQTFSGASAQLIVSGGRITGPANGCVRIESGSASVSGSANIDEIYLASGKTITAGTMNSDASVGIRMADVAGVFASGVATDVSSSFHGAGQRVSYDGTAKTLALIAHQNHCICGGIGTAGTHTACAAATWTAWNSTTSLPTESGYYYLTCNVETWVNTPVAAGDVYICLNGYTVTGKTNDRILRAFGGANMHYTVCNCEEEGGFVGKATFNGQAGLFWVASNATNSITLYNCKVDASQTAIGTYGGIATNDSGTFAAYHCEFIGGSAGGNGGIIASQNTTYLYDCVLKNGSSTGENGGLISMHGGTLTIDHCTLENGTVTKAGKNGGNLWINGGTTTITDSQFVGGSVSEAIGSSIFIGNGTVTMENTSVEGDIYAGTNSHLTVKSGNYNGKMQSESGTAAFIQGGKFARRPANAQIKENLIAKQLNPSVSVTIGTQNCTMNYEVLEGFIISVSSKAQEGDLIRLATVSGGATYAKNEAVTLSASTVPCYSFIGWFDGDTSLSQEQTFVTTAVKSAEYIAVYRYNGGATGFNVKTEAEDTSLLSYQIGSGAAVNGAMNENLTAGTRVTLSYLGAAEDFFGWVNETGKVVSKKTAYTAVIGSDATYRAVTQTAAGKKVALLSKYAQILQTIDWTSDSVLPEGPRYFGLTFAGWTLTEDEINASSETYLTVVATYTENEDEYTVTVKQATVTSLETMDGFALIGSEDLVVKKKTGEFATLTADASVSVSSETYVFAGYLDESKKLIGTTPTVILRKADGGARMVYAVYQKTAPEAMPCVTMDMASLNGQNAFFEMVRTLPENCTLVEQGLIYTTSLVSGMNSFEAASDALYIGSSAAKKIVSSGTAPIGVTSLNMKNIGTATVYAKGYVVFEKDGKTGIIYTATAKCSAEGGQISAK